MTRFYASLSRLFILRLWGGSVRHQPHANQPCFWRLGRASHFNLIFATLKVNRAALPASQILPSRAYIFASIPSSFLIDYDPTTSLLFHNHQLVCQLGVQAATIVLPEDRNTDKRRCFGRFYLLPSLGSLSRLSPPSIGINLIDRGRRILRAPTI